MTTPRPWIRRGSLQAFTLLEVIVVILIIMLLVAVLLPVLARGKGSATSSACLQVGGQLGQSIDLYLVDNNDKYPAGTDFYFSHPPHTRLTAWTFAQAVAPYGTKSLRCPITSQVSQIPTHLRSGYAINDLLSLLIQQSEGIAIVGIDASLVSNPARIVRLAEARSGVITMIQPDRNDIVYNGDIPDDIKDLVLSEPEGAKRHAGRANYIFCDGHAKSLNFLSFYGRLDLPVSF